MKPKELISKIKERHPKASKKEITRAAFYAVITAAEDAPERINDLHNLAMSTRNSPVEETQDNSEDEQHQPKSREG